MQFNICILLLQYYSNEVIIKVDHYTISRSKYISFHVLKSQSSLKVILPSKSCCQGECLVHPSAAQHSNKGDEKQGLIKFWVQT